MTSSSKLCKGYDFKPRTLETVWEDEAEPSNAEHELLPTEETVIRIDLLGLGAPRSDGGWSMSMPAAAPDRALVLPYSVLK